jgi:hypothetical protein
MKSFSSSAHSSNVPGVEVIAMVILQVGLVL